MTRAPRRERERRAPTSVSLGWGLYTSQCLVPGMDWTRLFRHEQSAFPSWIKPTPEQMCGQRGREYIYEIKQTLILVSRPWVIDHPNFTKKLIITGGDKELPCEFGKADGTKPQCVRGTCFLSFCVLHGVRMYQKDAGAVNIYPLVANIPVWMRARADLTSPRLTGGCWRVTKETKLSHLKENSVGVAVICGEP